MSAAAELYPLLFGDLPADAWPVGDDADGEPWASFVRARQHLAAGDQDLAAREWAGIAATLGAESRNVLQAWHLLRSINIHPDASIAAEVLGVVLEVEVPGGHDVLAAYRDGSVRYLNHAGGAAVVEPGAPTAELDADELAALVAGVIAAAQPLADVLDPWGEPKLPVVPDGHSRLCLLTRGGHRFGQGPSDALWAEPAAAAVLAPATGLLMAVT